MQPDTYYEAETLDDLLSGVLTRLLDQEELIQASRGCFSEQFGAMLVLHNPRARLSRSEKKGKVFSALGELFWYLSKNNSLEFMEYYLPGTYVKESDDNISVRSGYGKRFFCHNGQDQIQNVIDLLKRKDTSRRAVIQLFDASDLSENFKSIPCTCTLQFMIRGAKLCLLVNMRSNDAFHGLPHDVFAFTMLQEIVARSVGVEVGVYKHSVGSLHLYEGHFEMARTYLSEGWHLPIPMPPMPIGDPWGAILAVRKIEELARTMQRVDFTAVGLDAYWADICRMFVVFQKYKAAQLSHIDVASELANIKNELSYKVYEIFIDAKLDALSE